MDIKECKEVSHGGREMNKKDGRCPLCGKELLGYTNGASYGFAPGYPYESGFYCPNRCGSWSDLEISRGTLDALKHLPSARKEKG